MKHFTNKRVVYRLDLIITFWIISISETLTFGLSNKSLKLEKFLTLPSLVILSYFASLVCAFLRGRSCRCIQASQIFLRGSLESSIVVCEWVSPYGWFPVCSGCQGRKRCTKLPDTDRSCGCFHGCRVCVSWLQPWAEQGKLQLWFKSQN